MKILKSSGTVWLFIHPTYVADGFGTRCMTYEQHKSFEDCIAAMDNLIRYWKATRWQ